MNVLHSNLRSLLKVESHENEDSYGLVLTYDDYEKCRYAILFAIYLRKKYSMSLL